MVRALLVIGCVLLAGLPVRAQGQKWEVYGGYQFTRFEVPFSNLKASGNGWDVALSHDINDWVAAKVDVSGSYNGGRTYFAGVTTGALNLYTYMFGPTVSVHVTGNFKFFGEFLAGGYRDYNQYFASSPAQGLALMAGGGVDEEGGKHFAWRVIEADWLPFVSGTQSFNYPSTAIKSNFRISTGLVIRL